MFKQLGFILTLWRPLWSFLVQMVISKISEQIDLSTGTSFSKFWPILTEIQTKTSNIWGKNCYLPTTSYRLSLYKHVLLVERKPSKTSWERKTIKWTTKLSIKRKAKEKKQRARKKIEIDSPRNQVQILVPAHARKTKESSPIKSN